MSSLKKFIKFLTGYNHLKQRFRHKFINSMLYPFALSGHISIEESRFLMKVVRDTNNVTGPIIEIGTLFGFSTLDIVRAKDPNRRMITVENFRWNPAGLIQSEHISLTKKILSEAFEKDSVELMITNKSDFYNNYSLEPPSLIFIDADHSYEGTFEDLQWAKKVGAHTIAGHDYSSECPGVVKAVNDIFKGKPRDLCGSLFII